MIAPGLDARLREARLAQELTQQQLADAAGIGRNAVWRIENGQVAEPGLPTLQALARALGTSVLYLRQGVR